MEKSKKTSPKSKHRANKVKAKLLSTYYGHPIKDMKLICITGTAGKTEVAHFVHEILRTAAQPVAILASESAIKLSTLHKFLSDAWKSGANYVIVTAPAESLDADIFYGLPVHIAAMTNFLPASLDAPSPDEYKNAGSILFKMSPDYVVLNRDDATYPDFSSFAGTKGTLTYGADPSSTVRIASSQLYKKGTEAHLSISGLNFTAATFLTGEPVVSYMAAAAAIANALHISPEKVSDGIANYDPSAS